MASSTAALLGGPAAGRLPTAAVLAVLAAAAMVGLVAVGSGAPGRPAALAMGDAFEARPQSPNGVEYIGEIPVDAVFDYGLMDRPAVDVAHALCNKDTDPDCETSIAPLVDRDRARTQSLIMPWYEVASTGDGMGPESVTYWKLPPKAQMMQAQQADAAKAADETLAATNTATTAKGKASALGGFPAPPNTYQEPTVWNGDHVLNGGNKEWAEEDAALHAYNMQRWRNKIIGEQIDRQRSQWDLMNEADWCDCNCGARGNNGWQFKGARGTCGHHRRDRAHAENRRCGHCSDG